MSNFQEPVLLPNAEDAPRQVVRGMRASTAPAIVEYAFPDAGPRAGDPAELHQILSPLMRRKGTILAAACAGLAAALVISALMKPAYRAHTSLQIQGFTDEVAVRAITPVSPVLPNATAADYIQNQVKVLLSDTLASRVADRLGLQAKPLRHGPVGRLIESWRNHIPLLREHSKTPEELRIEQVKKALSVETSIQSQVIDVYYTADDPRTAAAGANAAAQEFMNMNREARFQLVKDTTEWLEKQAADLKKKVEQSNVQLQNYAQSAGLVFAGKEDTLAQDRMKQLQEALARAEADRAAKQARYEAVANSSVPVEDSAATGPLRQYETDLQAMKRDLMQLQSVYTANSPKVATLQAQIAQTEKAIADERQAILTRMRDEYLAAASLEKMLQSAQAVQLKTVEQQMRHERQYDTMKGESDTLARLYESTLEKLKEAGAASSLKSTNARVIDPAAPPSSPYAPNIPLNSALGLAFGAVGGIGLALIRDRSDKVTQPGELTRLNMVELGVIPSARQPRLLERARGELTPFKPRPVEPELATWTQDTSMLSESFRAALTSILFSTGLDNRRRNRNGQRGRVLVVTSLDPMAGKTTVLSNLGIASAERRQRVLLIDADLRRPRLHSVFNVPNDFGLADILQKGRGGDFLHSTPVESLVRPTEIPNVWITPSGPGTSAPASLLYSPELNALLQRLRKEFDLIYIDTPPMMLYSDGRFLGRHSDGVVIVVRANTMSRDEVRTMQLRLMQDQIPVLGTILNDWRMDQGRPYGKYYSRYEQRPGERA
jgi:succinoglycan biosynthesis transport protein ExoP